MSNLTYPPCGFYKCHNDTNGASNNSNNNDNNNNDNNNGNTNNKNYDTHFSNR